MKLRSMKDIQILQRGAKFKTTPYLLIDKKNLLENCRAFNSAFPSTQIYYSVKDNSHPDILTVLLQEGINFDVASWGEVEYLRNLNVPPERIILCATTKIPEHIRLAHEFGIRVFAFDSRIELEKISQLAPRSKVVARLIVKNTGSEWPLEKKFGLTDDETLEFMPIAKKIGLATWGSPFMWVHKTPDLLHGEML
jgi:ornithine decarboxylase